MSNLDNVIRKIKALRARAADAASTEAEAEIAARKAAELLAAHNLSISEVDVRAEGLVRESWNTGQSRIPALFMAGFGIEALCNVKLLAGSGKIDVIGTPADVEVALYFLDLTRNAIWSCWEKYKTGGEYSFLVDYSGKSPRVVGNAFRKGVAVRKGERFVKMKPSEPVATGDGTNIVLIKGGMIDQFMRDNYKGKLGSFKPGLGDETSFVAGARAANNVAISRGVGSASANRKSLR